MRQEHLVAKLFHHLYDHIDHDRMVVFCPDGEAAKKGVTENLLVDKQVSDLRFYFLGGTEPFLAEVKIVAGGRIKFCGDAEPMAWHVGGYGHHKPLLWLGADEPLREFYCWEHLAFAPQLTPLAGRGRTSGGNNKTLNVPIPEQTQRFASAIQLASAVIAWAKNQPGIHP